MTATRIEFYILHCRIGHRRHREARLLIQINSSQNQRDIRALISNSRRWRMYRLSLTVTAVGLLLAGSASATPRAEFRRAPQDGFWGARYCLQGKDWGYPGLCQFSTYQSCLATASGTFSYCGIDPQYAFWLQRLRYGQPAY
jgi:hypothetical protein